MLLVRFSLMFVLAGGAVSAHAASFDCVAPVFPNYSSTNESARRVEKQVLAWRKCHAAYRAEHDRVEVARMNAEVESGLERWLAATRGYWTRQGASVATMSRLEREHGTHFHFANGESRIDKEEKKIAPR